MKLTPDQQKLLKRVRDEANFYDNNRRELHKLQTLNRMGLVKLGIQRDMFSSFWSITSKGREILEA